MSSDISTTAKSAPIFGCLFCLKTFSQKSELLTHKENTHYVHANHTRGLSTKFHASSDQHWIDIGSSTTPQLGQQDNSSSPTQHSKSGQGQNINVRRTTTSPVTANKSRKWKCKTCFKSLFSKSAYLDHMRLHTGEMPYQCSCCKRLFHSSKSLWSHRHNSGPRHYGGPERCQLSRGRKHPRARKQSPDSNSPTSAKISPKKPSLMQHSLKRQSSVVIDSNSAKMTSSSSVSHNNGQLQGKSVTDNLECGQCHRILYDRRALDDHIRTHAGIKPFNCPNCKMTYSSKSAMYHHRKRCLAKNLTGVRVLDCEARKLQSDSVPFSSPSPKIRTKKEILMREGLIKPVLNRTKTLKPCQSNSMHTISNIPSTSKNCNSPVLEPETKNVAGKLWLICQVCGKTLSTSSTLKSHMEIYHKSFDYQHSSLATLRAEPKQPRIVESAPNPVNGLKLQCPHCPKILSSRWNLRSHISLHTGEKLFKCKKCGKWFSNYKKKSKHQKLCLNSEQHTTNLRTQRKTIQSQSLRLDYPSKLRARLKKRKQQTPESCPICAKVVIRCNMPAHIRLHNGEKPFGCTRCPNKYPSRTSLYSHRKLHCAGVIKSSAITNGIIDQDQQTSAVATTSTSFGKEDNVPRGTTDTFEKSANDNELIVEMSGIAEAVHRNDVIEIKNKSYPQQNLKAFECQHCGRVLANADNLDFHIKLHSKNLPYKCSYCKLSFYHRTSLEYHVGKAHVNQPQKSPLVKNGRTLLSRATSVNSTNKAASVLNVNHLIKEEEPSKSQMVQIASNSKGFGRIIRQVKTLGLDYQKKRRARKQMNQYTPESCPICAKVVVRRNMPAHIRLHTGEKPYACTRCPNKYPSKMSLYTHRLKTCTGVGTTSRSSENTNGNAKQAQQTTLVAAPSTSFGDHDNISLVKSDRPEKSHKYEELVVEMNGMADAAYRKDSTTIINKNDPQQNLKAFECQHCGKVLANADNLHFHIKLHSKNLRYKCSYCRLSFYHRPLLEYHEGKAHGNQPQTIPGRVKNGRTMSLKVATAVNSSLSAGSVLNANQLIQEEQSSKSQKKKIGNNHKGSGRRIRQAHTCPLCQKILTSTGNLESHMRLHTGEVPFHCSTCGLRYPSQKSLQVHERLKHRKRKMSSDEAECQSNKVDTLVSVPDEDSPKLQIKAEVAEVPTLKASMCPFCVTTCQTPSELLIHIRAAHIKT